MKRTDAAYGLAILAREMFAEIDTYSFSNNVVKIPPRRGFALRDAIHTSQPHGGTALGAAIHLVQTHAKYDRIIVLTDEQSQDRVPPPSDKGYIINVASYKNGVGYGQWHHVNGWSESVLKYIKQKEKSYSEF
jgi:hypothetical protein